MLRPVQMLLQQITVDLPELGFGLVYSQPLQDGC